jgi:hypothetical protein
LSKYILWSLNQASGLIDRLWNENSPNNIFSLFTKHGKSIELGNNGMFYASTNWASNYTYPKHRLMLETDGYIKGPNNIEEYFVPITLKCIGNSPTPIGDPFLQNLDSGLLQRIKDNNFPYNLSNFDENIFWESPAPINPIQKMQMATSLKRGYLQLLFDYLQLPQHHDQGKKHILVGYSQGGLVARFIQYLDRYVYRTHVIAGVITIASPNWGSPAANKYNLNNINTVLTQIINHNIQAVLPLSDAISTYLNSAFPNAAALKSVPDLVTYLDQQLTKFAENKKSFIQVQRDLNLAISMRKWLSGLVPHMGLNTAFNDLGITNYGNSYSVLSLVNDNNPYHIETNTGYYGAIINTNNRAIELASSALGLPIDYIPIPALQTNFEEISDLYQSIMTDVPESIDGFTDKSRFEKYQEKIMRSKVYLGDKANRHDFVIPSSNQVIHEKGPDGYLGNLLSETNHISGTQNTFEQLRKLLEKLAEK